MHGRARLQGGLRSQRRGVRCVERVFSKCALCYISFRTTKPMKEGHLASSDIVWWRTFIRQDLAHTVTRSSEVAHGKTFRCACTPYLSERVISGLSTGHPLLQFESRVNVYGLLVEKPSSIHCLNAKPGVLRTEYHMSKL